MSRAIRFAGVVAVVLGGLSVADDAHARRRLEFAETVIEGEVQKPEVAVYIGRENLNKAYELELKESFLPRIVEALSRPPF